MSRTRQAARATAKYLAIALVTVVVCLVFFVQGRQYLLRYRVKHLLADFHALRLKQSNWQDAQRLMTRWGKFGHYDGPCTPRECSYLITVGDTVSTLGDAHSAGWPLGRG